MRPPETSWLRTIRSSFPTRKVHIPSCRAGVGRPSDIFSPTFPITLYSKPFGKARYVSPVFFAAVGTSSPYPGERKAARSPSNENASARRASPPQARARPPENAVRLERKDLLSID